jgi:hypothetical protein
MTRLKVEFHLLHSVWSVFSCPKYIICCVLQFLSRSILCLPTHPTAQGMGNFCSSRFAPYEWCWVKGHGTSGFLVHTPVCSVVIILCATVFLLAEVLISYKIGMIANWRRWTVGIVVYVKCIKYRDQHISSEVWKKRAQEVNFSHIYFIFCLLTQV